MTTLQEHLNHQIDFISGREVGLDMYGLEGYVYLSEDGGHVAASLNIYPAYTNFFSDEELDEVDMGLIELHYGVTDTGAEWENATLETCGSFHPDTTLEDALGALFDKAQPLIQDLVTGKFEDELRKAMED